MKENKSISVFGAGQMGTRIGEVACREHDVVFFDIDPEKAQQSADRFGGRSANDIRQALDSQILFLAVPGSAVIQLLKDHYSAVSMDTLWVNISTFVTLKDMQAVTGKSGNIISCKIIGQSELVSDENPSAFIIDSSQSESSLVPVVGDIFKKVGVVIFDHEEKYREVNYIGAAEAMRGVIYVANTLRDMGLQKEVIRAAITQVFIGTAIQFPYANPDYFHDLVYGRNPGLRKSNEKLLDALKQDG
ncbi:MAG: NAD(P)-binding domain-containing protein [Deltaproteobacteria bacterium]|nr:NAD(P)-binding domain-containing protein [Deltaproteobacteria bacterium]